jgi:uncharacterized cupredoxin-like copper-binding protein
VESVSNRRRRLLGIFAVIVGIALILTASSGTVSHELAPATSETSRPAVEALGTPTTVTVNTTDTPSYQPNAISASEGTVLSIHVVNVGLFNHSFTVLATPNVRVPTNVTPTQLNAIVHANGTLANVTVAPGTSTWVNLTLNVSVPAGKVQNSYEILSIVPFQFQAGMSGYLNVTSSTPTGPAQVLFLNGTDQLHWIPNALGVENVTLPVRIDVGVGRLGATPHTWTLDPNPNSTVMNPSNFQQYLAANPPPAGANVSVNTPLGSFTWANFTLTKLGVYNFICEIPGHYANGMNGSLFVNVPIPKVSSPSTAIVMPGVLAVGAGLVGVGVVLVVAVSYQGRFKPPPPERQVP